jgi:hypothetical protein
VFTIIYQRRSADVDKLRSVYANWAGAMLDLLLSREAATDVNKRSSASSGYIAPESLLALPDNRDLVDAVERDRRVVFRYSYELAMLERDNQYRARVKALTDDLAVGWDYSHAADPDGDGADGAKVEHALDVLADDLRVRWKEFWAEQP